MKNTVNNRWFRNVNEKEIYVNDRAVRIRTGILIAIPLYIAFSLFDVIFTSNWISDGNVVVNDANWRESITSLVNATKGIHQYPMQTAALFYALFEIVAGMFILTSRFSPAIFISSFLAKGKPPEWKPLSLKRFAWSMNLSIIVICLVNLNQGTFAGWLYLSTGNELLPLTGNYVANWVPIALVLICVSFMWLESVVGICVACKLHELLVWLGVFKEKCQACDEINWDTQHKNKRNKELVILDDTSQLTTK